MEIGYARDLPFYKASEQKADLLKWKPRLKVYVEGEGAETLAAVVLAFRKQPGTVCLATDMRVLGDSQQDFLAAYKVLKNAGLVVLDTKNHERSNRDGVEMQKRAAAGLQRDRALGGDPRTPKKRGRRGGIKKGEKAAAKRAEIASEDVIRRICTFEKLTWRDRAYLLGISMATLRRRYLDKL